MTIIEKQLEIARTIMQTGLVSKVYHSCELLRSDKKGTLYPVYSKGAEYIDVAPDDTKKLFAYIRYNGDISAQPLKLVSCANQYEAFIPLRVVFYNDIEQQDFNFLQNKLTSFTFLNNVTLVRIVNDKWKLKKDETDFNGQKFDAQTFYLAIDVLAKTVLLKNECDDAKCESFTNPIC